MNIRYPKGSIITKKDDPKKYCILKAKKDTYECVVYPIGKITSNSNIIIPFTEVDKIFFWGKLFDDQKKTMKEEIFKELRRKAEEKCH